MPKEPTTSAKPPPVNSTAEQDRIYLLARYSEKIDYYWKASKSNKGAFKGNRYAVTSLGALVTFVAAISSAEFIAPESGWDLTVRIATPTLALFLTILSGLSQSFQWGATWRDMVINAEILERERDRVTLSDATTLDFVAESELLNNMIINESQGFFERVLGRSKPMETKKPKKGEA